MHDLQLFTVVLGLVAFVVPSFLAVYFWRDKGGIGRRISYMLIGEVVSMGSAAYFAFNSYLNTYNTMSPELAMLLRWLIFGTALFSTVKLYLYLRKIRGD